MGGELAVSSLTVLAANFTQFLGWVVEFIQTIATEPILLVGVGLMVVGWVIRLAYRAVKGRS